MKSRQELAEESVQQQIIGSILDLEASSSLKISELVKKFYVEHPTFKPDKHLILKCVRCNEPFTRSNSDVRKAIRKGYIDIYCSATCSEHDHAIKNKRRCQLCNELLPKSTGGRRSLAKYCPECHANHISKTNGLMVACKECGEIFIANGLQRTFCSRKCTSAHYSRKEYRKEHLYPILFNEISPLIRERDGNCCVVCGKQEKINFYRSTLRTNMMIHHIDITPMNNVPENLVTLCPNCHSAVHHLNLIQFQWLQDYAKTRSQFMTSKLKKRITILQQESFHTTA